MYVGVSVCVEVQFSILYIELKLQFSFSLTTFEKTTYDLRSNKIPRYKSYKKQKNQITTTS